MHALLDAAPAGPMESADQLDRFREADGFDEEQDQPAPARSIARALAGGSPVAILDGVPTLVLLQRDAEGRALGFSLEDVR